MLRSAFCWSIADAKARQESYPHPPQFSSSVRANLPTWRSVCVICASVYCGVASGVGGNCSAIENSGLRGTCSATYSLYRNTRYRLAAVAQRSAPGCPPIAGPFTHPPSHASSSIIRLCSIWFWSWSKPSMARSIAERPEKFMNAESFTPTLALIPAIIPPSTG